MLLFSFIFNNKMATLNATEHAQDVLKEVAIIFIHLSSVSQSCLTLCNPMDCSMPGFPVHHQLPELTRTHVNQVGDTIQPSHPLSSPSPAFNPYSLYRFFILQLSHPYM